MHDVIALGNLLWKAERLAQLFDWQRRTTFASAKHIECFLTIYSCNVCKCFRCFSTGGFRKSRGRGHSNDYSGSYNLFFFDVGLICFWIQPIPKSRHFSLQPEVRGV
ncbi:Uncharacterized protein APZ42_032805 [Daphnia magna]|uniref:Uncharacterized protein n=1 Tax=Daphnia magna TaxID=35525 RepID=A0A162D925_9CRUS|nr:Uncharacterized protein APZ42_032805 [Daphnia magna]